MGKRTKRKGGVREKGRKTLIWGKKCLANQYLKGKEKSGG